MSIPIKTLTLPISSGGSTTETEYSFITPEDMDQKANVDGYYENLVSGGTEQLLSSVYEEDSEPYLFRTSGGSMDIGDREEDTIVGGTIAWNQMCDISTIDNGTVSGITYTNNHDGTFTLSGTQTSQALNIWALGGYNRQEELFRITANHVYLLSEIRPFGFDDTNEYIMFINTTYLGKGLTIKKPNKSGKVTGIRIADTDSFDGTVTNYKMPIVFFDLTQMFGSTIADYIYSLETATAGAGVAWFKKLFPKPYYAYNAGELLSVEGLQSHDMVGFNAWDEEWELGTYNETTGAPNSGTQNIRSKNFIPVISGQNYYFTSPQSIVKLGYDADKNYIGKIGIDTPNVVRTIPEGCAYIKFYMYKAYGTTYNNDICINLSWDGERDGEYEPYVKRSYPLDDSLTLRGIPKLDSANKLYYDGDIYEADGTVTRKYGIVDLGSLTWYTNTASGGAVRFGTTGLVNTVAKSTMNAICSYYKTETSAESYNKNTGIAVAGDGVVYVYDPAHESKTAAEFKTAMSGVYLVYELATPTTEEAEPYQTPQIVDDFGTEEYVTDSIVPVGHVTKYMPNLKAKLEMAPDSPSDNGDYIVRHTNGLNEYVPLVIPTELPTMPSEDGTYHLKVTVTNGTPVVSWEAE